MKSALKLTSLVLLAATVAGLPLSAPAQTKAQPTTEKQPAVEKKGGTPAQKEAAGNKAKPLPFQGKLASVDATAKTLTVGQRTFQITSETKLYLADRSTPATLSAATPGERVTGSYRKGSDGKLLAVSVYFGETNQGKAGAKQKAPAEKPTKTNPAQ